MVLLGCSHCCSWDFEGKVQCHTIFLKTATSVWAKYWGSPKIRRVYKETQRLHARSPVSPSIRLHLSLSLNTTFRLSFSLSAGNCCFWRCLRGSRLFAMLRTISRNEGQLSHSATCTTLFRTGGYASGEVLKNTYSKMSGRIWYLPVSVYVCIHTQHNM